LVFTKKFDITKQEKSQWTFTVEKNQARRVPDMEIWGLAGRQDDGGIKNSGGL